MELRSCGHLHFIQAIKGGLVTKVLNVSRGRPTLSFKEVSDIYDGFMFDNDNVKAERSCIDVMEDKIVKTEPDSLECNANGDDQRINNLDDDGFDTLTLKQIKERCKTRKRKHSQGFDSSKGKVKTEDPSSLEDNKEKKQTEADDSDLVETLSSWRTKISKNMKAKKRKCVKDPVSSKEIVLVVKSEEIQNGQDFPPSSADSSALVEVKPEVPENDCFDRPDDYSDIEGKDADMTHEWNFENELNYNWKRQFDFIPLQMVRPSCLDIVISNPELSSDQSANLPAIEFDYHNSDIYDNQLDDDTDTPISPPNVAIHKGLDCRGMEFRDESDDDTFLGECSKDDDTDTPISPPNVATHKGLDCRGMEFRDDDTFLGECSKDEFAAGAEVQAEPCSTIEHDVNPDGCLVCHSDVSPEHEEKQSFTSVCDDEKRHVNESTELTSLDEHKGSSKLHGPERLLSTRKAISPSSQERLCKAMDSIDLNHKNNPKCRGKLPFAEQSDKNGVAEGLNDIKRTGFTDSPKKISVIPKTSKRGSHPKGISKIPHSSRPATSLGFSSVQSCSKSAIAFSKQQMHGIECIAMKLTKELKSMKDIMDDMLRSEFCLNTSLRYKVNEARMAVKNATRAEEATKRCLSFMARDCNRFCKIMKLADGNPSPPQDTVRREKKIAFADEAGGRLCQVRFYKDNEVYLSEEH